jgi:argininosuccinate lyase
VALLTLLKGLPMAYNRDLQEDKERLFDSVDTVRATVRLVTSMLKETKVNEAACAAASSDPTLLATDLADYLVRKGIPFRRAHHVVGAVVAFAEGAGRPISQLTLAELKQADEAFSEDVTRVFELKSALAQRRCIGAPGQVQQQLARWRRKLVRT